MPLMQWDDTMSMGVAELDEQHQKLIDLINETFDAIRRADGHSLPDLIARMHDYAALHFRDEEAAMLEAGFPELEDHVEQHAVFSSQVDDFRDNLHNAADMPEVFVFLSRWLTNHIMVEDRKFLPYTADSE